MKANTIDVVEIMARAIDRARCDAGRPDPDKGLAEFIATAALEAIRSAGYVVVPVEPTEAMWRAMTLEGDSHKATSPDYRLVYRAMIAAAEGGE